MGTSRAEVGGPGREGFLKEGFGSLELLPQHSFGNNIGIQFATDGKSILSSLWFESHRLDIFFEKRIQFLNNIDLLYLLKKFSD